eukprot:354069-Chlamydomonas_euryale.AAC.4
MSQNEADRNIQNQGDRPRLLAAFAVPGGAKSTELIDVQHSVLDPKPLCLSGSYGGFPSRRHCVTRAPLAPLCELPPPSRQLLPVLAADVVGVAARVLAVGAVGAAAALQRGCACKLLLRHQALSKLVLHLALLQVSADEHHALAAVSPALVPAAAPLGHHARRQPGRQPLAIRRGRHGAACCRPLPRERWQASHPEEALGAKQTRWQPVGRLAYARCAAGVAAALVPVGTGARPGGCSVAWPEQAPQALRMEWRGGVKYDAADAVLRLLAGGRPRRGRRRARHRQQARGA